MYTCNCIWHYMAMFGHSYDFVLHSFLRVVTFVYWQRRLNGLLRCHSHTPSAMTTCGNLGDRAQQKCGD